MKGALSFKVIGGIVFLNTKDGYRLIMVGDELDTYSNSNLNQLSKVC